MTSKALGLPPTRQSLVVVNGRIDRADYSDRVARKGGTPKFPYGDQADHGIAPHELCFAKKNPDRGALRFNEPAIAVFASFNGIDDTETEDDFRFVGVSQTTIPEPLVGNGHLSMSAAGVVRIFNTGQQNIEIGDRVVWKLPERDGPKGRIEGMSNTKVYAVVERLKFSPQEAVGTAVEKFIKENNKTNGDSLKKLVQEQASEKSRLIGVALSRAQSGESFDILLRYC